MTVTLYVTAVKSELLHLRQEQTFSKLKRWRVSVFPALRGKTCNRHFSDAESSEASQLPKIMMAIPQLAKFQAKQQLKLPVLGGIH